MTGEKKPGLYRIVRKKKVRFFRVRKDGLTGFMTVIELEHVENTSREIPTTKKLLSDKMWEKLTFWQ
jgi:hypothetical protein